MGRILAVNGALASPSHGVSSQAGGARSATFRELLLCFIAIAA